MVYTDDEDHFQIIAGVNHVMHMAAISAKQTHPQSQRVHGKSLQQCLIISAFVDSCSFWFSLHVKGKTPHRPLFLLLLMLL
jgi:hypothetical protein